MLKVLLVDDEPFIVQGLKVLLDWEKEGFEIVGSASDGREALCFLAEYEVDLIIADINMPYMTGLELLQKIRKEKISDAYFMILSGHADFSYAQQAIRYECTDYVLKPVDVDELTSILFKIRRMNENVKAKDETVQAMEYAYLARNMIALISGKYDNQNLDYVNSHMKCEGKISYINIELDRVVNEEEFPKRNIPTTR